MSSTIQPSVITGGSVYGVAQVEYTIAGEDGRNFIDAVTLASFIQATAIEEATSAYSNASKLVKKANHAATATINNIE